MPKSIPRGRATPRLIRDMKPKRQLPRCQIVDQSEESWWQEANQSGENGDGPDATNTDSNHDSLDTNNDASGESPEATINDDATQQGNRFRSSLNRKRVCLMIWEWHKRTSCLKKLKQLFWTFILFRTLKLIYNVDLDNYSSSKWQAMEAYDSMSSVSNQLSPANVKPVGKSFFSNEDLAESAFYSNKAALFGLGESSYQSDSGLGQYTSSTKSKNIFDKTAHAVKSVFAPSAEKIGSNSQLNQGLGDIARKEASGNF